MNKIYNFKNKEFDFSKCYLMGILNVTPDSFSDAGSYFNVKAAIDHGLEMLDDGADIIDIGGESTRPGASSVTEQEEIERVIPVIEGILKINNNAVISVDTTKCKVAQLALKEGAAIINDISGLTYEPEIINVVKEHDAGVIIMHIKGIPRTMQDNPVYEDLFKEVSGVLKKQAKFAEKNGINKIILDPGIGFGKTLGHNFEILQKLNYFTNLGYPLLIGVSRKSFLGKALNLDVDKRDIATAIVESSAVQQGARIIRSHNIKISNQVKVLLNKIINV